jgi:hypothetical protein
MDMAGGWSSDTICEDTDLGLTIQQQGWLTHYTNVAMARACCPTPMRLQEAAPPLGLWRLPDRQEALAALPARREPAFAGPAPRILARLAELARRRRASASWSAILNLIWVPIVAFADIAIPDKILTLPIIASFVVSLVHFIALYRLRVKIKAGQMLGAMIAAMSVQWTVSRAWRRA